MYILPSLRISIIYTRKWDLTMFQNENKTRFPIYDRITGAVALSICWNWRLWIAKIRETKTAGSTHYTRMPDRDTDRIFFPYRIFNRGLITASSYLFLYRIKINKDGSRECVQLRWPAPDPRIPNVRFHVNYCLYAWRETAITVPTLDTILWRN